MSKIVTDKLQKSGGQELTLPSALATANNQPLIGATNGQLSFSASALPSALATANNQPIVGQTTGILNFLPYAMPAADGSTGQFVKTDGSGNLSFGTVAVPPASIKSTSDPDATVAQGELGDFFVNTTSGESFICTFVGTGTIKRRWAGQLGTNIGYPQGQAIFYDGVNLPNGSDQPPAADFQTTWTCPSGVAQIHVVLVGGGGGGEPQWAGSSGGGGALAWANEIAVTAGTVYYLEVGTGGRHQTAGGHTTLRTGSHTGTIIFQAQGGVNNATNFANHIAKPVAGTVTPGNNASGRGGMSSQNGYGGGGGAGGYSGNGGNGYYGHNSTGQPNNTLNNSIDGTGGAASGGAGYQSSTYGFGGGGGVGLYGEGTSGTYLDQNSNSHQSHPYHEGIGGSGGEDGHTNNNATTSNGSARTNTFGYGTANDESNMVTTTGSGTPTGSRNVAHGQGGMFGGGGGGGGSSTSNNAAFCNGGLGGARIIWGKGRAFPSTNTGNVTTVAG